MIKYFYILCAVIPFTILYLMGTSKKESFELNKPIPAVIAVPEIVIESPVVELTREELLTKYLESINKINNNLLPFDEPKTEFGQEDGKLRPLFFQAYFRNKTKYSFNEDTYYVFGYDKDKKLYPKIPQVCADYIVDVIDHSFGNWYVGSSRYPQRIKGKFSVRDDAKLKELDVRKISDLITYFKTYPDNFEFVFEGDGPKIGKSKYLKDWFKEKEVQLGDIVVVTGRVPWATDHHSHSFIISSFENGLVSKVSGNAGNSREWSLNVESNRTPHRKIKYIIRLKNEFLKQMY